MQLKTRNTSPNIPASSNDRLLPMSAHVRSAFLARRERHLDAFAVLVVDDESRIRVAYVGEQGGNERNLPRE